MSSSQFRRSSLMPRKMSVENRDTYATIFQKHDTDNNGILDRKEVVDAISEVIGLKMFSNQADIMFDEFDKDDNNEIDFSEFTVMANYLKTAMKIPATRVSMVDSDMGGLRKSVDRFKLDMDYDNIDDDDDDDDDGQYQYDPVTKQLKKVYGLTQHPSIIDKNKERNNRKMAILLDSVVDQSKKNRNKILQEIAKQLYPVRDILCLQNANFDFDVDVNRGALATLNFDKLFDDAEEKKKSQINPMDEDFEAAFPPSDMRCLALVSHNGMKKTMREFVLANKNLLKKFRLTGTNSTMTMLKEVFKDEPTGSVMYGPACASGPLGGDAELVALMVAGRIGGIIFFQDPMNAHPHRADIDCLVRQALVHNTMLAENPTSAYMLAQCLRNALVNSKAELIPSFFFSLQSPTVEAYKNVQSSVVNSHKCAWK